MLSSLIGVINSVSETVLQGSLNSNAVADFFENRLQEWLNFGNTPWGVTAHIANITTTNGIEYERVNGGGTSLISYTVFNNNFNNSTWETVDRDIAQALILPNIEGIPIYSPDITVSKRADISQNAYILPSTGSKEVRIDNSVPRPRIWQINGYLQSPSLLLWLDNLSIIKKGLLMQASLLTDFMNSRLPVWFKTNTGEFVQVLISDFNQHFRAENMNVIEVSLTVQEYAVLNFSVGVANNVAAQEQTSSAVSAIANVSKSFLS